MSLFATLSSNELISLGVSGVSLVVSAFLAGWTVYRDVIQKPKFRVTIGVKKVHQGGLPEIGPDIYIEALNLGPLPNRIGVPYATPSWFRRRVLRKEAAFIGYDHRHIAHTATGQRVEVGDSATFVLPLDSEFIDEPNFSRIGVSDGFGRVHWSTRANYRRAQADVRTSRVRAEKVS
ncbi:hypothetical protein QKW60_08265 [Defluviimonas aestuarii]|uniref:hypothetical protein n=1 Tax=Albidovulum aestuarii TaxID=1130726 RepID=UPI00249A67F2|nr:hypothetical protein [Defluviimonas aestuarii]MDI3336396.1 hypothetical protein [Defluviimonas aestuarii]